MGLPEFEGGNYRSLRVESRHKPLRNPRFFDRQLVQPCLPCKLTTTPHPPSRADTQDVVAFLIFSWKLEAWQHPPTTPSVTKANRQLDRPGRNESGRVPDRHAGGPRLQEAKKPLFRGQHGRLTVTGSDAYGLPTATDTDVIVALIYLTKTRNEFQRLKVNFSRYELIKLLQLAGRSMVLQATSTSRSTVGTAYCWSMTNAGGIMNERFIQMLKCTLLKTLK